MERKLVTVRKISKIEDIPGADVIQVVTVDGWKVVVRKGEFQEGEYVVYFEIDSALPEKDKRYAFLMKNGVREFDGGKIHRLRTVKLRGQISQGLILPLNTFPEITKTLDGGCGKSNSKWMESGFQELLGIKKYEAPIPACLAGQVKGAFPSIVPKTDEERIQNIGYLWGQMDDTEFEISEKLDGTSATFGIHNDEFVVCSRNLNLCESDSNTYWKVARKFKIEESLRSEGLTELFIQGEIVGEGIQNNLYKIKGQTLYVFSMYDAKLGKYLSPFERVEICDKLKLQHVPIIGVKKLSEVGRSTDEVLNFADGPSLLNPQTIREGVVFKEVNDQTHFKAISNKFLLKFE
jgi:RNA ligase (TIGR02306 family)